MVGVGLDYMMSAARLGDVASMLYLGEAFDTGLNLARDMKVNIFVKLFFNRCFVCLLVFPVMKKVGLS